MASCCQGINFMIWIWIALFLIQTGREIFVVSAIRSNCALNDDYCDCGHDEMHSNACSFYQAGRKFQCSDNRFFNQTLFLSRVGDGVCDCCDGSDEIHSKRPFKCLNTCSEMGEIFKLESKKFDETYSNGVAEREIILQDEKSKVDDLRSSMLRAQKLIPRHKKLVAYYRNELIEQESLERIEFERIYAASKAAFAQSLYIFSAEILQQLLSIITLRSGDSGVESILVECDDTHDFRNREPDDVSAFALVAEDTCPAVSKEAYEESLLNGKFAFNQPPAESVLAMINALSLDQLSVDSLIDVCSHAIPRALGYGLPLSECFYQAGADLPIEDFLKSLPLSPVVVKTNGHKRSDAEALRTKILDLNSQIATQQEHAKNYKAIGNVTYGPNNSLFSLRDQCFTSDFKEHRYEICLFKEAKQGGTLIGNFEKIEVKMASSLDLARVDGIEMGERHSRESIYLYFVNGEICHGTQRPRDLILKLECGSGAASISEVAEPELCSYRATLVSPLGCL